MRKSQNTPPDAAALRRRAEEVVRASQAAAAPLSPEALREALHDLRVHQVELEMQNEELRRTQLELDAARARYSDLYDLAPVGYFTVSEQGLILEANLTAAALLGTARGALVKQPISHFIIKADQDTYYLHSKRLFETGEPQKCELRLVKPDGANFWAHLTATAARAEDGAPVCRMTFSDISERKRAEEALRVSEENFRAIADYTVDWEMWFGPDGALLWVNPAVERRTGYSVAECLAQPRFPESLIHEDDRERMRSAWQGALAGSRGDDLEFRYVHKDGKLGWGAISWQPIFGPNGKPLGHRASVRDITARKQAEEARRESEANLRALLAASTQSVLLLDVHGTVIEINETGAQRLGRRREEVPGTNVYDHLPPDMVALRRARLAQVVSGGQPVRFEDTRAGRVLDQSLVPIFDEAGQVVRVAVFAEDITERKQAEVALLEREEQLRSIASSIPGAIYQFVRRVDGTFEIPFMSEGARLLFGRPLEELQDSSRLFDDVHPEDVPGLWASIEASEKNLTPWNTEFRLVPKTASLRWLRGASNPHRMPDGGTSWYGVLLDITEQKRGEEQIRLQHTLALALAAASDLQQGLRLCLQTALQGSGLDAGGFYLLDETSGGLELCAHHGLCPSFVAATSRFEALSDQTRLVMAGLPAYAGLEDLGLGLSEAERREGLRFVAVIPLRQEGAVIGCMNVASHSVDNIPPANRQVLETIAATATQAIVRLRAQERLRASEALLNQTQRLSKVGGWEWNLIRQTMVWTEETYRLHDLSPQDVAPGADEHIRRSAACYGPEHQAAILEAFRRCVERGEAYDLEVPFTSVKGRSMWVRTIAQAVWEGNRIVKVVGNLMDITERKRAEEALWHSHGLLRAVLDNIPARVFWKDMNLNYLGCNRVFALDAGFQKPEDLIGKDDFAMGWREQAERYRRDDRDVIEKGTPRLLVEEPQTTPAGATIHLLTSKVPLRNTRDTVIGVLGTYMDVTERKHAEQALRQSDERFRAANEASLDCILMLRSERDGSGEIVDFIFVDLNRRAEEMLRMGREQLLGKRLCEELPINREAGFFAKYKHVVDTGVPLEEEFFLRETHVPAAWYSHQVVKVGDGILICHRDITGRKQAEAERERLEAQFRQAQKMESVGRLAGGVAHDFNNMLQTIQGTAELLLNSAPPESPDAADLQEIVRAAKRSADLTRQLLAFARKQTIAPRVLNLNDTIANTLKMLRRLIGEDIDLLWKPADDLWPVKMDPSQIDQLLANLTVNARDAISGVGRLTIATAAACLDADYCRAHVESAPGDYVVLTVTDTGCGMDAETQARIFEPFFTTKGEGKGTGLGLATVYGIVKQNNGSIEVHSEPGKGATFKVYLPRHAAAGGEAAADDAEGAAVPTGTETVLLVEDEAPLLRLATRLLTALGYTVLPAAGPQEALRIAAAHQHPIDLLLTDVVMPGMSGRELRNQLCAAQPNLKCLFMSGYTADVIAHRGVLDEGLQFIAKPFSQAAIAAKLRDVLDGARRSP